jgi:hypothetical protein
LITEEQYAILVTVVILSAIVPTVIAERWFDPGGEPPEEELDGTSKQRDQGADMLIPMTNARGNDVS